MPRSYALGVSVVLAAVALAAGLAPFVPDRSRPAAEDLSRIAEPLGRFSLRDQAGRSVTEADLAGRVWVADFIFTRCPSSCPILTRKMADLQRSLARTGVGLVSLSVDPDHDTPDRLAAYAAKFGADPRRWSFLTGPKDDVYSLILDRFRLGVQESDAAERAAGAEAVSHSNRFVLVDRGNRVVGVFGSDDPAALAALVARARTLDVGWVLILPTVNAALNGSAATLLVVAWILIRSGRARLHATAMAAALSVSAVFLASYLVYHAIVGSVAFRGGGAIRHAYFTVLLSHTALAAAVVPLIVLSLTRAFRGRYLHHARIARVTFPIWLYVSITGVVVYWMLYRLDVAATVATRV